MTDDVHVHRTLIGSEPPTCACGAVFLNDGWHMPPLDERTATEVACERLAAELRRQANEEAARHFPSSHDRVDAMAYAMRTEYPPRIVLDENPTTVWRDDANDPYATLVGFIDLIRSMIRRPTWLDRVSSDLDALDWMDDFLVNAWIDEACEDYQDRLAAMTLHHIDLSLIPLTNLVPAPRSVLLQSYASMPIINSTPYYASIPIV